ADDYMFDGYGRRITYTVDRRATGVQSCHDLQSNGTPGALQILDANNAANVNDNVMWALTSYGKDGQGAVPMSGGTTRIDAGTITPDKLSGAFCSTNSHDTCPVGYTGVISPVNTYYHDQVVKKSFTVTNGNVAGVSNFDNDVWYLPATKNMCCV